MILVVLGTEKYSFQRPLDLLEAYVVENRITEQIIVQSGYTVYRSDYMDITPFFSMHELNLLYDEARIVISHGGTGSVVAGIKMGKTVVVIPRLKKYNEHIDDHQLELVSAFDESNYIVPWNEGDDLSMVMKKTQEFSPATFLSGKESILNYVAKFIDGAI